MDDDNLDIGMMGISPHEEVSNEAPDKRTPEPDLEKIKAEIQELKVQLTSLQPEQREAACSRFLIALSDFVVNSTEHGKTGYGWLVRQILRPYRWLSVRLEPYILRASYRLLVDRSGVRNGYYEIVVKYEPSSFGRLMKRGEIRQGYRRREGVWSPYPFGTHWGSVNPSMANFLEKRFVADRLTQLVNQVDSINVRR